MSDAVPLVSLFDLLETDHKQAEFTALHEYVWRMGQELKSRMNAGVSPAEMPALCEAYAATQAGIVIIEKLSVFKP